MRDIYVMVGIVLFFIGCGDSKVANNTLEETFPKNIVISIPRKLEENREMLTSISTKSYTYEMMQRKLLNRRDKSTELQFNSILIQKVLPEIEKYCNNSLKGESCIVPAGTFFIQLTKPELRAIKKRYAALDIVFDVNSSLSFGEIRLFKETEEKLYTYHLEVDLLGIYKSIIGEPYEAFFEQKMLMIKQSFAWSNENNNSYVSLEEESNLSKDIFQMELLQSQENKETVHVYRRYQYLESSSINTLTWTKNNDENNSYDFNYNDSYEASYGFISDELGFNLKSSFYDNGQIAVFFDKAGYELGQYGCSGYDGCLLSDKSTWSREFGGENNASVLDEKFGLFMRNILDKNSSLDEGEYFLVPNNVQLSGHLNEQILQKSVGTFLVNNQELQGVIYNQEYIDSLENITIYKALSSIYDKSRYKKIDRENYPNFIIQDEIKEEEY